MGSGWVSLALKLKTENEWVTETLKHRALESHSFWKSPKGLNLGTVLCYSESGFCWWPQSLLLASVCRL